MESVKSKVFNYLTKAQKSELCHYLSKFTGKNAELSECEIIDKFLEDEQYYIDINSSRHPWLEEFFEDDAFYKELKLFVRDQIKKLEIKERQKPYVEKQKLMQKEQRKKAQEFKMSKDMPTKAQISYYKALCSKNNIDADLINVESVSKLDFKNAIDELINNNSDKETLLAHLQSIIDAKK